jgi:hypothetical protein
VIGGWIGVLADRVYDRPRHVTADVSRWLGAWRDRDGKFPIDSSGKLPSGESFQGAKELKEILKCVCLDCNSRSGG